MSIVSEQAVSPFGLCNQPSFGWGKQRLTENNRQLLTADANDVKLMQMSAAIASDSHHLHQQLTVAWYFVSVAFASNLRSFILWISCKTVERQLPCKMDVTPRNCAKIATLRKHTVETIGEISAVFLVSLATVWRVNLNRILHRFILNAFREVWS